jgi:hypothetical protein
MRFGRTRIVPGERRRGTGEEPDGRGRLDRDVPASSVTPGYGAVVGRQRQLADRSVVLAAADRLAERATAESWTHQERLAS